MLKRGLAMTTSNSSSSAPEKATNLTLRSKLLAKARELKINISQAAAEGITKAIAEKRAAIWQKENREALESANAWVEKHRMF